MTNREKALSVGLACRTTPIRVREPRRASNSRQSPAALVEPVLMPSVPRVQLDSSRLVVVQE